MKLDLVYFFNLIKDIPYILIKIDVPYVPPDFPMTYAVGKDLDIIIEKDNLLIMKDILIDYAKAYQGKFEIIKIDEKDGFRLRFHKKNKLHFQIDLSCRVEGVGESFVKASIRDRQLTGCYFITPEKYEMIYRYCFYQKKKNKKYHLDYIRKNISKVDNNLLKEVGINFYGIN